MAKKAKKVTKRGRKRTVKRAAGATRGALGSRRTRRRVAKNARKRASSRAGDGRSRGGDLATPGPSIPLRELVRGGLPRSRKAHHPGTVTTSPWASRRKKSASGLPMRGKIMQNQPDRLEHVGSLRMAIPKR